MPFTVEQFFDLFARYNLDLWPWQLVALTAGLLVVALLYRESRLSAVMTLAVLSAMWLVNGIGYHWLYFATINPAARLFAAAEQLREVVGVPLTYDAQDQYDRTMPQLTSALGDEAFAAAWAAGRAMSQDEAVADTLNDEGEDFLPR